MHTQHKHESQTKEASNFGAQKDMARTPSISNQHPGRITSSKLFASQSTLMHRVDIFLDTHSSIVFQTKCPHYAGHTPRHSF